MIYLEERFHPVEEMSASARDNPGTKETGQGKDSSSVRAPSVKKIPLWLMILLAAIIAIVFIWVMLIIIYPSLALS